MQSVVIDREKGANRFLLLILSIMIIICETPYLSRNMSTTVVELLMVAFLVLFFIGKHTLKAEFAKTVACVALYILLELVYKFTGISSAGIGYYFATIKFLFIFLAMACVGPLLNKRQQLFLLLLSIAGMIGNMASNVIIYSGMNPSAYVVYYLRGGQSTNAADTAFSTAVMLLMGAFFLIFLHANNKWLKIGSMAGVIYCLYFLIFISQRGTTFFLGIMMLLVILTFQVSSRRLLFVLVILSVFVFWLALGGIVPLLTWLSTLLKSERIDFKIDYIIRFFQTGSIEEAGGSLTGRFDLIMTSVHTFLGSMRSFFLGVGDHRDSTYLVGNHSQFVDTFARYGILGGVVFIRLLSQMRNTIIKISAVFENNSLHRQMIVMYAFFVIRTFLGNTFVGSIGTQLFITVPLMVSLLNNKEVSNYKQSSTN